MNISLSSLPSNGIIRSFHISAFAERIKAKLPATLWTIQKLAGALWIDIKVDGKRKVVTKRPILLVRKEQHNTRNNLKKQKYLRATVFIKYPTI